MQFWDPTHRAFVDMLDGFAQFPFIDDTTLVQPGALTSGACFSVLVHEYAHLMSLSGPISIFSAYTTAMSYAMREFALLKAEHDPQGLRFMTIDNDHQYFDVPAEQLASRCFMEQHSEYLRAYVNFFNAYRWLFEGLALFVQWDYEPNLSLAPSPLLRFAGAIINAQSPESALSGKEVSARLVSAFQAVRQAERQGRRKWALYTSQAASTRDYYVGYLLVKRAWHLLSSRESRLQDPEIFLRFLTKYLLQDWGILALCSSTEQGNVFDQENTTVNRLLVFQQNAVTRLVKMDADYLANAVTQLTQDPNSIWHFLKDGSDDLYSSSPDDQNKWLKSKEALNEGVRKRIGQEVTGQFQKLFADRAAPSIPGDACKSVIARTLDLYELMRSHHRLFKLHASSCRLVGYQPTEAGVNALFIFAQGNPPYWRLQTLQQARWKSLEADLLRSSARMVIFPYENMDLTKTRTLTESALKHLAGQFDAEALPPLFQTYDFYDDADQLIDARVFGEHVLLFNRRERTREIERADETARLVGHLNRASYWERLVFQLGVYGSGYDYFAEHLLVDDWESSEEQFLKKLLRNAWRTLFEKSVISDEELDLLWTIRIPRLIARSPEAMQLCEMLCTQGTLRVYAQDTAILERVDTLNQRWAARTGAPLIHRVTGDQAIDLVWQY